MCDASVCLGSGCLNAKVLGVMKAQYSDTSDFSVIHFTFKNKTKQKYKGRGCKFRRNDTKPCWEL